MMKTLAFVIFTSAVVLFAGCSGGSDGAANTASADPETAAKIEKAVAAAPTRGLLVGLETKTIEAWKSGDLAFWETHLDPSYVSFMGGRRLEKAGEIKMISDGRCEIGNHTFADEKMVPIGNDAIVLTVKATGERTCGGQKLPNPVITSTLYVRSGETWKAAYHNEVPIIDPPAPSKVAPAKPIARKKTETKPAEPQKSDPFSEELFAKESKVWDAWKAHDRAAIEQYFTEDLTLVGSTGTVTVGKKAVIDTWMLPKCDIKSAAPADGIATQISPVIGILTFKGNATGTCDGQPLESFWGTSIFQKKAGEWKIAFTLETPA